LESIPLKRKVDLPIEDFYGEQDADKKVEKRGKTCRNTTTNSMIYGVKDTRGISWTY
jgi:hypothetical protein